MKQFTIFHEKYEPWHCLALDHKGAGYQYAEFFDIVRDKEKFLRLGHFIDVDIVAEETGLKKKFRLVGRYDVEYDARQMWDTDLNG